MMRLKRSPKHHIKFWLETAQTRLREDWGIILVALGVAVVVWWHVTQLEYKARYFVDIDVEVSGLPDYLVLDDTRILPYASARIAGPASVINEADADCFTFRIDASGIDKPPTRELVLKPSHLIVNPSSPGVKSVESLLRISDRDITPKRIVVHVEYRKKQVEILIPDRVLDLDSSYQVINTSASPEYCVVAAGPKRLENLVSLSPKTARSVPLQFSENEEQTVPLSWPMSDLVAGEKNLRLIGNETARLVAQVTVAPGIIERELKNIPVKIREEEEEHRDYKIKPQKQIDVTLKGPRDLVSKLVSEATPGTWFYEVDTGNYTDGEHHIQVRPDGFVRPYGSPMPSVVSVTSVTPALSIELFGDPLSGSPWKPEHELKPQATPTVVPNPLSDFSTSVPFAPIMGPHLPPVELPGTVRSATRGG